jgi:hypothetical protein
MSGTKIASLASSASRNACSLPTAGTASPSRTATDVSTAPIAADDAVSNPSRCSSSINAAVEMITSAVAPSRSFAAMIPTAPNVPSMPQPVCAVNACVTLATSPCAAPPLRIFRLFTIVTSWRSR